MAITVNGAAANVTIAQLGDGSSADLAGNITDESGTGALVFNTDPTLSGVSLSDGSIVLEGATPDDWETTLTVTDPTADRTVTFQDATGTVVLRDSTDTLTNKTLTSPAITGGTLVNAVVKGLEEDVNVVASAATGTINLDVDTASIWYYTTDATADHTLNIRFSSGATLDSVLAVGDAVTVVWMNTNGATPYYPDVIQVDGSTVTPEWQGGTGPAAGNASSIDVYSFTVIKTAADPTYVVLGSQTQFA